MGDQEFRPAAVRARRKAMNENRMTLAQVRTPILLTTLMMYKTTGRMHHIHKKLAEPN